MLNMTLLEAIKLVILSIILGFFIGVPSGMAYQKWIGYEVIAEKLMKIIDNWTDEE